MAKKWNYTTHRLSLPPRKYNRIEYRQKLARVFLAEDPGSGDNATKYIYFVEKDSVSGRHVFLTHPAPKNKGIDFQVHIENHRFVHITSNGRKLHTDIPLHQDIVDDLLAKKKENPLLFKDLKPLLEKVFNCETIDNTEYKAFPFNSGFSVELLFKTIKWLFIEQDITYWNWSGREMLHNTLTPLWEPDLFDKQ